jgi:hypothetical protein
MICIFTEYRNVLSSREQNLAFVANKTVMDDTY